ncbi:GntR family transcriptional regulator [Vibrio artabrorum]|uniref:GntR family transcriptional regulator n=1 Tax=Vibrio artabrorum TaxID=446374 RepID=UPI00355232E4
MKTLLYERVRSEIEQRIEQRLYEAGEKLPTEAELCKEFNVSRITIRKAMKMLYESGIIIGVRGSGNFVREHHSQMYKYRLDSFAEENISSDYKNKVINFTLIPAPKEIAKLLKIGNDEYVHHAKRIRFKDGKPIQLEECWMPKSLFPDLSVATLEGSKYHYIENIKGYEIEKDDQTLVPILPSKDICKELNISRHKPILKISSVGYLTDGNPFEVSRVYFNTHGYNVTIVATR